VDDTETTLKLIVILDLTPQNISCHMKIVAGVCQITLVITVLVSTIFCSLFLVKHHILDFKMYEYYFILLVFYGVLHVVICQSVSQ